MDSFANKNSFLSDLHARLAQHGFNYSETIGRSKLIECYTIPLVVVVVVEADSLSNIIYQEQEQKKSLEGMY